MEEMKAKNKKRKFSNRKSERGRGEDRLSNLPDHIIQHILCFLETKQAIKTSVLSKKWRSQWKHLPVLDLVGYSFMKPTSFRKFVSSILRHGPHRPFISKLRFVGWVGRPGREEAILDRIFRHVCFDRIENLVMDACEAHYVLPRPILTCPRLKTIKLRSFVLPESFGSSTIARLRLTCCSFSMNGGGCLNPFADCPNLIRLSLIEVDFKGCKEFKILAPKLLCLTMSCHYRRLHENCVYEISAPKLTSFSYRTFEATINFVGIDLPCLQYVDITIQIPSGRKQRTQKAYLNLITLFQGLQNSQFVSLTPSTITALNWFPRMLVNKPSPFNRLKCLKIKPNGEYPCFKIPVIVMNYLCGGSPCTEIKLGNDFKMTVCEARRSIDDLHLVSY